MTTIRDESAVSRSLAAQAASGESARPREPHMIALRDLPEPARRSATASGKIIPGDGQHRADGVRVGPKGCRGLYWAFGRHRPGDGYTTQVIFAGPFTEVSGCPADTIGP